MHATVIPKLKRPVTSQISPHAGTKQSMNEQFNAKLIQHGTDIGVPQSELPDPSSKQSSFGNPHQRKNKASKLDGAATLQSSAAGGYTSSCYQLKQKQAARPPSGYVVRRQPVASSMAFDSNTNR